MTSLFTSPGCQNAKEPSVHLKSHPKFGSGMKIVPCIILNWKKYIYRHSVSAIITAFSNSPLLMELIKRSWKHPASQGYVLCLHCVDRSWTAMVAKRHPPLGDRRWIRSNLDSLQDPSGFSKKPLRIVSELFPNKSAPVKLTVRSLEPRCQSALQGNWSIKFL